MGQQEQQEQGGAERVLSDLGKSLDKGLGRVGGLLQRIKDIDKPNPENVDLLITKLEARSIKTTDPADSELMKAAASCIRNYVRREDKNND